MSPLNDLVAPVRAVLDEALAATELPDWEAVARVIAERTGLNLSTAEVCVRQVRDRLEPPHVEVTVRDLAYPPCGDVELTITHRLRPRAWQLYGAQAARRV